MGSTLFQFHPSLKRVKEALLFSSPLTLTQQTHKSRKG